MSATETPPAEATSEQLAEAATQIIEKVKPLFDASDYDREDLQIPRVDGQSVDKIRIDFAGSVMLDRSDPADVALFNRLTLGEDCELRCSGKVSGSGAGFTTSKDGDLDSVVAKKTVKVDSVWVLASEAL